MTARLKGEHGLFPDMTKKGTLIASGGWTVRTVSGLRLRSSSV
jgi:hypothetical protein